MTEAVATVGWYLGLQYDQQGKMKKMLVMARSSCARTFNDSPLPSALSASAAESRTL
jgi:hypothetical protein